MILKSSKMKSFLGSRSVFSVLCCSLVTITFHGTSFRLGVATWQKVLGRDTKREEKRGSG